MDDLCARHDNVTPSQMMGMPCVKRNGKMVAGFTRGAMVFKLPDPDTHAQALALDGAHLFDPGVRAAVQAVGRRAGDARRAVGIVPRGSQARWLNRLAAAASAARAVPAHAPRRERRPSSRLPRRGRRTRSGPTRARRRSSDGRADPPSTSGRRRATPPGRARLPRGSPAPARRPGSPRRAPAAARLFVPRNEQRSCFGNPRPRRHLHDGDD